MAEVTEVLVQMADGVTAAMRRASTALLSADGDWAGTVLQNDRDFDALYHRVEDKVSQLLARQAPVARDLRLTIAALHVGGDLERMGDLAAHVAKTAQRRAHEPAVVPEL